MSRSGDPVRQCRKNQGSNLGGSCGKNRASPEDHIPKISTRAKCFGVFAVCLARLGALLYPRRNKRNAFLCSGVQKALYAVRHLFRKAEPV